MKALLNNIIFGYTNFTVYIIIKVGLTFIGKSPW